MATAQETLNQATLDKYTKYANHMVNNYDFDYDPFSKKPQPCSLKDYPVMNGTQLRKFALGSINYDNKNIQKAIQKETSPKAKKLLQKALVTTDNNKLLSYTQDFRSIKGVEFEFNGLVSKFFNDQLLHKTLNNPHAHMTVFEIQNDEDTDINENYLLGKLDKHASDYKYQVRKIKADLAYSQDMAEINCYNDVNDPSTPTLLYDDIPANFGRGKSSEDEDLTDAQQLFMSYDFQDSLEDGSSIPDDLVGKFNHLYHDRVVKDKQEVHMLNRTVYQANRPNEYRFFYLNRLYQKFLYYQRQNVRKDYHPDRDLGETKLQMYKWNIVLAVKEFDEMVQEHNAMHTIIPSLKSPVMYLKHDKKDPIFDTYEPTKAVDKLTTKQTKDLMMEIFDTIC